MFSSTSVYSCALSAERARPANRSLKLELSDLQVTFGAVDRSRNARRAGVGAWARQTLALDEIQESWLRADGSRIPGAKGFPGGAVGTTGGVRRASQWEARSERDFHWAQTRDLCPNRRESPANRGDVADLRLAPSIGEVALLLGLRSPCHRVSPGFAGRHVTTPSRRRVFSILGSGELPGPPLARRVRPDPGRRERASGVVSLSGMDALIP